jgi:hypothetical protein
MDKSKHMIMGVHVTDRVRHVEEVQKALTRHGCAIRTRLGLHDTHGEHCSPDGLILLELLDEAEGWKLSEELAQIEGIDVQHMIFEHP